MYFNKKIIYVVENADWVIRWEGEYITRYLNEKYKVKSGIFDIVCVIDPLQTLSGIIQ